MYCTQTISVHISCDVSVQQHPDRCDVNQSRQVLLLLIDIAKNDIDAPAVQWEGDHQGKELSQMTAR